MRRFSSSVGLVILFAFGAAAAWAQAVRDVAQPTQEQRLAKIREAEHAVRSFLRLNPRLEEVQLANVAIAQLCVEQARLALDATWFSWYYGEDYPEKKLVESAQALARAERKEPVPVKPGVCELAYFSAVDGSCQPYHLLVPEGYDPMKPIPVIFFLHGYDPMVSKIYPWVPGDYMLEALSKVNMIMAIPYGRKNTDFLGPGEVDVLDVVAEVKKRIKVDEERVYLTGVSAGASGVWTMAAHYPGLFAAILPFCGRTNYYLWKQLDPRTLPVPQRLLISTNNPIETPENMRATPCVIYHGELDPAIEPQHSEQMAEKIKAFGNSELNICEGVGHRVWESVLVDDPIPFRKILKITHQLLPERVTFTSFSPKYNRAHWVEVERIKEFGQPFTVDARIVGPGRVEVESTNVAAMKLHLPPLEAGGEWQVKGLPEPPPPAEGLEKTPSLCGPIENAYCAPFAMVFPTQGPEDERTRDRALAEFNAKHWAEFADGTPRTYDDTGITDYLKSRYNLVAFGSPKTNAIIAQAAPKLPVKFLDGGFEFGGKKIVGNDLGLVMVYPNPLAPGRLLCIHSGAIWGKDAELNHRIDAAPDLIIFRARGDGWFRPDETLCMAFFDVHWKPDPKLTYFAPGI